MTQYIGILPSGSYMTPGDTLDTQGQTLGELSFDANGNIVLYSPVGTRVASFGLTSAAGSIWMNLDGNLCVYRASDSVCVWALNGRCPLVAGAWLRIVSQGLEIRKPSQAQEGDLVYTLFANALMP